MVTLMSRIEPARALAKNSFSSSVATRTRNMVGVSRKRGRDVFGACSVLQGLTAELGSRLNTPPTPTHVTGNLRWPVNTSSQI
jgi:hypothetical protein